MVAPLKSEILYERIIRSSNSFVPVWAGCDFCDEGYSNAEVEVLGKRKA